MPVTNTLLFAFTLFAALSCGLMGGVFFAFSTFVMKGLSRLPVGEGIAAMQAINLVVPNSLFGVTFLITPLICILAMIFSLAGWHDPARRGRVIFVLVGGALYLLGSLVVTIVCNVPMNDTLAAVTADTTNQAKLWASFLPNWTAWNHVRTLASFAATLSLILALVYRTTPE